MSTYSASPPVTASTTEPSATKASQPFSAANANAGARAPRRCSRKGATASGQTMPASSWPASIRAATTREGPMP